VILASSRKDSLPHYPFRKYAGEKFFRLGLQPSAGVILDDVGTTQGGSPFFTSNVGARVCPTMSGKSVVLSPTSPRQGEKSIVELQPKQGSISLSGLPLQNLELRASLLDQIAGGRGVVR
jgi:hypothetical protein